jgi:hypothetical protein
MRSFKPMPSPIYVFLSRRSSHGLVEGAVIKGLVLERHHHTLAFEPQIDAAKVGVAVINGRRQAPNHP